MANKPTKVHSVTFTLRKFVIAKVTLSQDFVKISIIVTLYQDVGNSDHCPKFVLRSS